MPATVRRAAEQPDAEGRSRCCAAVTGAEQVGAWSRANDQRPAGRRRAVADAWRYSRAAEGSESRLQAAMCSALAKDLGCRPGLSRLRAAPAARLVSCGAPPRRRLRARARAAAGRRAPDRARRRRRGAMRRARGRARRCLNPVVARVRARASMQTTAHRERPYKSGTLLTQRWRRAAREVWSRSRKRAGDTIYHGWGFAHVRRAPTRVGVRSRPSGVSPFRRAPQAAAGGDHVSDLPAMGLSGAPTISGVRGWSRPAFGGVGLCSRPSRTPRVGFCSRWRPDRAGWGFAHFPTLAKLARLRSEGPLT